MSQLCLHVCITCKSFLATFILDILTCNKWEEKWCKLLHLTPGPLFQKVISENRIRSGLREVVDSFYENLTAITERDGTLSEACRKYSSDCLQNMIQNELKHFETVVNVSFLQEIITFALLEY